MGNLSNYTIYTIGHSNHSLDYFMGLLKEVGITAIADVRSSPYSRFAPHFNKKELEPFLKKEETQCGASSISSVVFRSNL